MFSKTNNNTTFTVALPSTTGSTAKPSATPVKDWESAFGQLSSSYGFNGGVPSVPKKSSPTNSSTPSRSPKTQPSPKNTKNWEASFDQLSSSYGLGGGVPSVPPKQSHKTTRSPKNSDTQSQNNATNPPGHLLEQYGFGSGPQSRT